MGEGVNHLYIGEQPFNSSTVQKFNDIGEQPFNYIGEAAVQKFNENRREP
jgi:hypothetical protein